MAERFAPALLPSIILVAACVLLAPPSGARQPNSNDFTAYLAQGYRQMAAEAERSADGGTLSSYFQQRWGLVAKGGTLAPEDPTSHALDSWTLREAAFARRQLVERLDSGARQRQALLAAIAQVNFDCWVAPAPRRIGQPDRDECRRRFYFAFAGLTPADRLASNTASQTAPPATIVVPVPVDPRITRLGSGVVASTQSAAATPQDCGENCVIAAFTGPAADALISKLRQNGSDHGSDSSGPTGTNDGSRTGASAASSSGSAPASTGASGSSGGQSSASSDSDSSSSGDSGSASNSSDSQDSSSSDQSDSGPGKGHGKGHGKGRGKGP